MDPHNFIETAIWQRPPNTLSDGPNTDHKACKRYFRQCRNVGHDWYGSSQHEPEDYIMLGFGLF